MTPEGLAAIVATLFSLAFLLIPRLNVWYAAKPKEDQQAIMGIITVTTGVVIWALACTQVGVLLGFTLILCPAGGWQSLVLVIIAAIIPNQTVYRVIPAPKAVREIKQLKEQINKPV